MATARSKRKRAGADQQPSMQGAAPPPVINSAEVPSVYVNSLELLSAGEFDVRIGFNEVSVERGADNNPVITSHRKANIVMATEHFFSMLTLLSLNGNAIMEARRARVAEQLGQVKAQGQTEPEVHR